MSRRSSRAPLASLSLLLALPISGSSGSIVEVARLRGTAQINAVFFPEGIDSSNVYGSDLLATGSGSSLLLESGAEEKVQLAEITTARVNKDDSALVIMLRRGKLHLRSGGARRSCWKIKMSDFVLQARPAW